jgi:lysophospholipase L1-like esterase
VTGLTAASGAPLSLNLAGALSDTKAILQSGQQANIVVLGDSLSFRPGTYLPTFRSLLQTRYGNAGAGYQGLSLWSGAGFNLGWLGTGINVDNPPHRSLDGLWNRYDGVAGWPNMALITPQGRRVQIQYVTQPGAGSFYLRRGDTGDIVTTIDTSGPSGVATYDYTLPSTDTQFTIHPVGNGSFTVLGHNNVSSNQGVRVHRAANGGWGVNNFLQRDFTFDRQLGLLDTDLIMVWIGQNDQAFTQQTYAQKIDQLVTRLQGAAPTAEIMLIGTYNQGAPALAGLVEGMAQVATSRGVGFLNLYASAGTPQFFQANGYLDDGVHFSPAGGNYMGHFLYNAFISDGRSLNPAVMPDYFPGFDINQLPIGNEGTFPEPGAVGGVAAALVTFGRRRRRT